MDVTEEQMERRGRGRSEIFLLIQISKTSSVSIRFVRLLTCNLNHDVPCLYTIAISIQDYEVAR